MVNPQVKKQNHIYILKKILFCFDVQMSYTHCQIYASQMIQRFKFEIAVLFLVGVGLKGCVIYLQKKGKKNI